MAQQIRSILIAEKDLADKKAEVDARIAGMTSLEEVAEAFGTTVSHYPGMSFSSTVYSQNDPGLVGAATSAEKGTIHTVAGTAGVYAFQVADRWNGSFFSDADAANQLTRKASYHTNLLQSVMADEADIKDNRARFF